jgi:hypothetical protein
MGLVIFQFFGGIWASDGRVDVFRCLWAVGLSQALPPGFLRRPSPGSGCGGSFLIDGFAFFGCELVSHRKQGVVGDGLGGPFAFGRGPKVVAASLCASSR